MGDAPKTEMVAVRVSEEVKELVEVYAKREAYRRSTPDERLTKSDVLREHIRELADQADELDEPTLRRELEQLDQDGGDDR